MESYWPSKRKSVQLQRMITGPDDGTKDVVQAEAFAWMGERATDLASGSTRGPSTRQAGNRGFQEAPWDLTIQCGLTDPSLQAH